MRDMFSEMQDLNRDDRRAFMEEMREKMQERMKQFEQEADRILLPHQKDRLRQLSYQTAGRGQGAGGALGNEALLEELGVTEEQRKAIEEATTKAREELQKKYQDLVREAEDDIDGRAVRVPARGRLGPWTGRR
jgi:vacuolar-type H+-ATPase subunit H